MTFQTSPSSGRQFRKLAALWLFIVLFAAAFPGIQPVLAENVSVKVTGVFDQNGARSMLPMVNAFRLGTNGEDNPPWQLTAGETRSRDEGGTYETVTGLKALAYDYTLERAAMQRALETALYWDHRRPDGTPASSSGSEKGWLLQLPGGYYTRGENIACGHNRFTTALSVFTAWKETNENYAGQGHRRNMLNTKFTAVGIAHVTHNGWEFWVQEFGAPAKDTTYTAPFNGRGSSQITFSTDRVTPEDLRKADGTQTITVVYGETVPIPDTLVRLKILYAEDAPSAGYRSLVSAPLSWSVAHPALLGLSGNVLTGKQAGTTRLVTTFAGKTMSLLVEIRAADLGKAVLTGLKTAAYTGKAVKEVPSVQFDGRTLVKGKDYKLSYSGNKKTGTASVTVTGMGNYSGTVTGSYQIVLPKGGVYRDKKTGGVYKITKVTSAAKAEVTLMKTEKPVSSFTIPSSVKISNTTCKVTAISAYAFKGQKQLEKVIIGKNVAKIGKQAFKNCKSLRSVKIRTKKLTKKAIGASAFSKIAADAIFTLPASKKSAYRKILITKGAKRTMTFR